MGINWHGPQTTDDRRTLFKSFLLPDKDCVPILKKMYGGDDGSTKQDIMEYGDLLTNFFGCEEKGKDVLEAVDNYIWDMLDWYHYICKKKRKIDTWENLGVTEYVKFEFISMATLARTLWETSG